MALRSHTLVWTILTPAQTEELSTLAENNEYILDGEMMSSLVKVYTPSDDHTKNQITWPHRVDEGLLRKIYPHIISAD
ncbi:MAG: hypothetical protein ACJAVI_003218 [Candidatus Azotimanducaceae bacterium]